MDRWRFDIAYDGTDFHGWACQPGLRTVQAVCESALTIALGLPDPIRLYCAGRTDAGVHARGQVAHADVKYADMDDAEIENNSDSRKAVDPNDLLRRMAGLLPHDIAVRACSQVTEDFDARFSALYRRYSYVLVDTAASVDPIRRHAMVRHPRSLNLQAMNAAAELLLGEHDFTAFCRARPRGSMVRTLQTCSWSRKSTGEVVLDIRADAFCRSMVRAVVGALVAVGDGREDVAWVGEVLGHRRKHHRVTVMPAAGLTLEEVGYPSSTDWGAQQTVTRVRRGQPMSRSEDC